MRIKNNIIPLPAPERQPEKRPAFAPPWIAIRRQLFTLIAQGQGDPFTKEAFAIIFGPGSVGPPNSATADAGVFYITDEKPKYRKRAYQTFQKFHEAYYGQELAIPETFTPQDLRTYRLVFCWERAKKAYLHFQKQNLPPKKKSS
jgi:hypothetical protein